MKEETKKTKQRFILTVTNTWESQFSQEYTLSILKMLRLKNLCLQRHIKSYLISVYRIRCSCSLWPFMLNIASKPYQKKKRKKDGTCSLPRVYVCKIRNVLKLKIIRNWVTIKNIFNTYMGKWNGSIQKHTIVRNPNTTESN